MQRRRCDDAVLVVAEHALKLLVVLGRCLCALVEGLAKFGGISGPLGGFAGTVQQRVVARLDRLGQSPIGLAPGAAGPFLHRFGARWFGQRRRGAPSLQRREQAEVSLRVHRVRNDCAGLQLVRLQIGVDPVGDRPEDELRRQLRHRFAEAAALYLAVADFAE